MDQLKGSGKNWRCLRLESNAAAIKGLEARLNAERLRRRAFLEETKGHIPMHEAAKAAGITRESAWRLIRETKEGK